MVIRSHSNAIVFVAAAALCSMAIPSLADWGGTMSAAGSSSRIDSVTSRSVDQQYSVFAAGTAASKWNYLLSCRYKHLQSQIGDQPALWQTELQPTASLRMAARRFSVRGEYSYRSNRDEQNVNLLTGQSASTYLQMTPFSLLRIHTGTDWAKNVNDLELIGFDTRSSTFNGGASLNARHLAVVYDYTDRTTRNPRTRLERTSRSHRGRLENTLSLWSGLTELQTSVQVVDRSEHENVQNGEQTLITLPATSGLHADDISPEFGQLESSAGLIDGQLSLPADDRFDLSGSMFHNFGLYFGATTEVDHLHLYTDTLANPGMVWTVWTSPDNQTWTRVPGNVTVSFSPVFYRYEFAFAPLLTTHIKLAVSPSPALAPVRVTELRGFIARSTGQGTAHSTDRRAGSQFRFTPAKWMNIGVGGDLARIGATQTSLAREEDSYHSDIRFAPADRWQSSARYTRARVLYPESSARESSTSESINASLRSRWSSALTTTLTLNRTNEWRDQRNYRRNDAARAETQTVIFPALRSGTQAGYSEDHRLEVGTVFFTRFVSHYFEGQPTHRTDLRAEYRREWLSARGSTVPEFRELLSLRGSIQLSTNLSVFATESEQREPGRRDMSFDGTATWAATRKLTVSAGLNRLSGNVQEHSVQYSVQGAFRWTVRTDISFAYSFTDQADGRDIASARLGFNTRF